MKSYYISTAKKLRMIASSGIVRTGDRELIDKVIDIWETYYDGKATMDVYATIDIGKSACLNFVAGTGCIYLGSIKQSVARRYVWDNNLPLVNERGASAI